ncbi:AAA family ATPase [Halomarina halobia]|uniref:ORC1-type DNA replication protein n=1 Tax=Halomarina halobia TaxID=3033386 RepID=A0ABD6ABJ5_9EURY|nr:AAA family ATPase [Halomarina sp. PSR21]
MTDEDTDGPRSSDSRGEGPTDEGPVDGESTDEESADEESISEESTVHTANADARSSDHRFEEKNDRSGETDDADETDDVAADSRESTAAGESVIEDASDAAGDATDDPADGGPVDGGPAVDEPVGDEPVGDASVGDALDASGRTAGAAGTVDDSLSFPGTSGTFSDDALADETDEASPGLFDDLLSGEPIFENKEVLRPSYTPRRLPHREEQINNMATILVTALRGETPSNILIYGKTGTGKTASAKFVSEELETTSQKYEVPCEVQYINCEVTDTQYRVLAQLANKFIEENRKRIDAHLDRLTNLRDTAEDDPSVLDGTDFSNLDALRTRVEELQADREGFEPVPMTGWPTDRVYSTFFEAVDYQERVVVIMLDEIDKLVEKSGDDTLYNLSRMNSELVNSRVSIMGISNDLKFTDFLDPRVKSSLGEEEIVFPPYDANQLRDILQARADVAFKDGALSEDVIPLCAAFAAQEHGDARRALDLLRTAGELAERDRTERINEEHVRRAQEKIELDRVVEVVRTLPTQSKLVLYSVILLERNGVHNINTGEVFNIYKRLCAEIDMDVLTQRRVTDLISELDMLGIVNAVVVSKGRYGRTKEMSLSVPLDETEAVLLSDSRLGDVEDAQPFVQARFDDN